MESYFMCKFTYAKLITDKLKWTPFVGKSGRPLNPRPCEYECKCAHSFDKIKLFPSIYQFNSIDKGKYDWVALYVALTKTLKDDRNIKGMNFIQLIQRWKNLATENRKNKSLNGYFLPNDMEDFAWAFERTTHYCPDAMKVNNMIAEKKSGLDLSDLCLATGMNCKHGVTNMNELVCADDFLNGTCSCPSIGVKDRMIHYTDYKMIPFNKQYEEYNAIKSRTTVQGFEALDSEIKMVSTNIKGVKKLSLKK